MLTSHIGCKLLFELRDPRALRHPAGAKYFQNTNLLFFPNEGSGDWDHRAAGTEHSTHFKPPAASVISDLASSRHWTSVRSPDSRPTCALKPSRFSAFSIAARLA